MAPLPADAPKSDRELLLEVHRDVGYIKTKMDKHDVRISNLENWRWYIIGGISVLTLVGVIWGRLIDIHIIQP